MNIKCVVLIFVLLFSRVILATDLIGEILIISKVKHTFTMNIGASDGLGLFDQAILYYKNKKIARVELKKNSDTKSGWVVLEMFDEEALITGRTFKIIIEKNQNKERVEDAMRQEAEKKIRKDFSLAFNRIGLQFLKIERESGYFNSLKFSWVPNFRFNQNLFLIPKTYITMYKIEENDIVVAGIDFLLRRYFGYFLIGAGVGAENWIAKSNGGIHYSYKGEFGLRIGTFHLLGGLSNLSVAGEKLQELSLGVELDF